MTTALPQRVPGTSSYPYSRDFRRYPLLSRKEERTLACRWRDGQEKAVADRLVTAHLRLVAKVAGRYQRYGLPAGDLISQGTIGLMHAVRCFDPDRDVRFATYAMWWIRAEIQAYILHSWSLVKIGTTAAQRKLFFNLRRLKLQIHAGDEGDMEAGHVKRIARLLNVPEQDVINTNRRMMAPDSSLNVPTHAGSDATWQDWLPDESETQEDVLAQREELEIRKRLLADAFKVLKDRERHIVAERRLKEVPTTLDDLGRHYGISRERVRQIEDRALKKLRAAMNASMVDYAPQRWAEVHHGAS